MMVLWLGSKGGLLHCPPWPAVAAAASSSCILRSTRRSKGVAWGLTARSGMYLRVVLATPATCSACAFGWGPGACVQVGGGLDAARRVSCSYYLTVHDDEAALVRGGGVVCLWVLARLLAGCGCGCRGAG